MFRSLRRSVKPVLWMVVIGFVGSIFLYWGMQYSPGGHLPPRVARVDGQELSVARFQRLYEGYTNLYRSIFKEKFDESMAESLQNRVIEELIKERILLNEAERVGIKVKDEEVIDQIKKSFLDKDGNFDPKRYDNYIKQIAFRFRISEEKVGADLEEEVRTSLKVDKLVNLITDTVRVTDLELEDYYERVTREHDKKNFEARREELTETLCNQKAQQVYEAWYNFLKKKTRIELNPTL